MNLQWNLTASVYFSVHLGFSAAAITGKHAATVLYDSHRVWLKSLHTGQLDCKTIHKMSKHKISSTYCTERGLSTKTIQAICWFNTLALTLLLLSLLLNCYLGVHLHEKHRRSVIKKPN